MVEVVQDILDHVTYAGGVGRRRVDAIRGISVGSLALGAADCALLPESLEDPGDIPGLKGPRIVPMQKLMFHEVLDRAFEEKTYHLQLEEFAFRGEKIIAQVDQKLGEIQRMIGHDVLARSKHLPAHLQLVNDELRFAQQLVCHELQDVWRMRFEPFFYPDDPSASTRSTSAEGSPMQRGVSDGSGKEQASSGTPLGGWLDLDDMFLTGRLLTIYLAGLAKLISLVTRYLPASQLERSRLRSGGQVSPELARVVNMFSKNTPWVGASLPTGQAERLSTEPAALPQRSARLSNADTTSSQAARALAGTSALNQAMTSLDRVLTVHLKQLVSDLHRTMYQTFVRICAAYIAVLQREHCCPFLGLSLCIRTQPPIRRMCGLELLYIVPN
eukprot:TRINITY_DN7255_c0_g1_i3.p1 TRINITY_DN7255_c0_g1~~TRINITY_DN7255_c0_g1_i3.p1  ORF type:complete len:386 (-),score=59.76 TRINITY_DN7255_c0_g1_i3:159-1316(-)